MAMNKDGSGLREAQLKRLRYAIVDMALKVANNSSLVKAGFDVAVHNPALIKRVQRPVAVAHKRIKPAIEKFIDQVSAIVGAPMPLAWSRTKPMTQKRR